MYAELKEDLHYSIRHVVLGLYITENSMNSKGLRLDTLLSSKSNILDRYIIIKI